MTPQKKMLIITGAGLVIGLAEALIYYNLGRNAASETGFAFGVPKGKELTKTMGIVLATSLATALLSNTLENVLDKKELITI